MVDAAEATRQYTITVLGRTLEHLGVQMYKRRDVAIAELVANCWDGGATEVRIEVPAPAEYDKDRSEIVITDNGTGMDPDEVQDSYLVVGRNRRQAEVDEARLAVQGNATRRDQADGSRLVMGRKGIGKLAGFGIASSMSVLTWREGKSVLLTLDMNALKVRDGEAGSVPIMGKIGGLPDDVASPTGTRITLTNLKHKASGFACW